MVHQDEKKVGLSTEEYLNTIVDFIATNNTAPPLQYHKNQIMTVYINTKVYLYSTGAVYLTPHLKVNFLIILYLNIFKQKE